MARLPTLLIACCSLVIVWIACQDAEAGKSNLVIKTAPAAGIIELLPQISTATPTPTPTCCMFTGTVGSICQSNPGGLYDINVNAAINNPCGQTQTQAANFYLEVSTDGTNFEFISRTSIQNYTFQPGQNTINEAFQNQSIPGQYTYYRVRMQVYACGIYSIYSPASAICQSSPTPTPSASPTATITPTPTPTASPTPGFEGDIAPRPNGDGAVLATDVTQMRRFATGLDTPNPATNEAQRADCAPRAASGDGIINAGDVVQARRYATGLDPITPAGGPTGPSSPGIFPLQIPGRFYSPPSGMISTFTLYEPELSSRLPSFMPRKRAPSR